MTRTALLPLALFASLASAVGCSQDDEIVYEQFNATDDTIEVEVGVEELLPARTESLYSSTGEVEVGQVTVDPGGGPIGTNHEVLVVVTNDDPEYWASEIDRVTVRTSPPDDSRAIAEDEYDLEQDSAKEGYWKITLESVGDPGEVRTDTLTVRLLRIDEAASAEAADEEEEAADAR